MNGRLNGQLDTTLGKLAAQVAGDAEDLARLVLELLLGDEEDACTLARATSERSE